jgi:N,N'-diacetyllegionaminate synthase
MVIVEIGNNHLGVLDHAKELIRVAVESGAQYIKSQAFNGYDINFGSQSYGFYDRCSFTIDEYIELIEYAKELNATMFYSIFSPEYEVLKKHMLYNKYSAMQSNMMPQEWVSERDCENAIFSINTITKTDYDKNDSFYFPKINKAKIMYASPYLQDPIWDMLIILRRHYWKTIGYSDHSIGIGNVKEAVLRYGCNVIEKHFKLNIESTYRDYEHSMNPTQLEELIKFME